VEEKKNVEPRGHHFVPACWLAGFTASGEKDDRIWVTDLSRGKQWKSEPGKAGRIRDFYRIDHPNLDPVIAEKSLSQIEDSIAPLLKALDRERREPNNDELDTLCNFIAIQFVRIPSFRPFALSVLESVNREELAAALRTAETWAATLKEAGIATDAPGAEYERACEAQRSGKYLLSVDTTWYVKQAFESVSRILPGLRSRYWNTVFSTTGSFIACDSPVIMEGPKDEWIGFENADFISYAVSRHVTLFGTATRRAPVFATRIEIAEMNTLAMRRADKQVYSHASDFCWLDERRKHQTDWTLFSKDKP
jgi:hypothetical protein